MDKDTKRRIVLLRFSYWVGAACDAVVGVRMLMPEMMGEAGFRYAMGTSAALMFGWTGLLIWADRKPVERKGVLLITIFPVLAGLMVAAVWPVLDGVFPIERMIPIWSLGAAIICLMGFSYYHARDMQ